MFRKVIPEDPSFNVWLSAGIGVPLGTLVVVIFLAIFRSDSISQSVQYLLDSLVISAFAYVVVAVVLLVYALPLLKISLRFGVARPPTAVVIGVLPGVVAIIWFGVVSVYSWLALSIGCSTSLTYAFLAYRGERL